MHLQDLAADITKVKNITLEKTNTKERQMYTDEHVEKWLPGFLWVISLYKSAQDNIDRSIARGTMRKLVAKFSDRPPTLASKKALELAAAHGQDLFSMRWAHRNRCGKVKGKPALMWEHTTPNSVLCDQLLSCESADDIRDALKNYSGVCWITREEDDLLNKAGYLAKRPGGWKECYSSVGIETVTKNNGS